MCRAYAEPQFPLYAGEQVSDVIASIVHLVDGARLAGIPVVYTGVRLLPGGADGGIFFRKVPSLSLFIGDTEAGRLVPELDPRADEVVIMKQYPSAFFSTPLASMLHASGVDTVMLCGVSTSGCVRASATDAMQLGFIPIVVREAVGDRHSGPHEANLFDIDAKIGDVVSEAEALSYLQTFVTEKS